MFALGLQHLPGELSVIDIAAVNQMDRAAFVDYFGAVFEATPAIAQHAWQMRPFADLDALHQAMVSVVGGLSPAAQLALIQAHPDLGSRAKMADASVQEQAGAGLDRLTPAEYDQFQTLNAAYKAKFGFPFILAVKGHTQSSILQSFETRLQNDIPEEIAQALTEIGQIARFRLEEWVE